MRIYLTVTAATIEPSLASGTDAWIVDLGREEVGVLASRLDEAVADGRQTLHYRIANAADSAVADTLAASALPRPASILIPAAHGRDIAQAGAALAVHEAQQGWPDGATRIVALVTKAAGALNLASFAGASPRLAGIGWDAASLADELGLDRSEVTSGSDSPLVQVRSLVRLAAAAARVEAIEAECPVGGVARLHAQRAIRDGFGAILAQAPDDVAAIRSI